MNKEQRKKAGFKRITAYCVAESFKMKLLTGFLKREHNVAPRVFDEALYVMYHLPLLPGYGPNANVRSSAVVQTNDVLARLSEAEEIGYQGSYFTNQQHGHREDGYITSSPVERRSVPESSSVPLVSDSDAYSQTDAEDPEPVISPISDPEQPRTPFVMPIPSISPSHPPPLPTSTTYPSISPTTPFSASYQENAEVIFFEFGVVVFFGLSEVQEKSILEDLENNRIMQRRIPEAHWEIEECHFAYDMGIKAPRVYNDFFTLKSHSHLLKLSISHALAQSTLLARFESTTAQILSSPHTLSIPTQLAKSGSIHLPRREALKLTGKLFKLRLDINLVSNVLDVPELFWDEASLKELYDAVRDYFEIGVRVEALNERLGVASGFLEAIHDHLNNSAMERITWIVIWLIVVAILVELGEVVARLIVHATMGSEGEPVAAGMLPRIPLDKEDVLRTLDRMVLTGSL
ncbi:Sad1-interacting factor 3 [Stygiomarasmius scandens]|uniref:Sad1-interacting factor 3 n=1 Tax=Marasmiellus scandens TaxID=2682957 RepID=A0ABR1JPK5_9AGAR